MKALKIVFMLTLTVTLFSVAVYFVEGVTSEIIETRQAEEIEAALKTIFPDIDGTTDTVESDLQDFGTTGISDVLVITDGSGNPKGYVYTVSFQGFASTITYLIGINAEGNITGYQTLAQSDTPGYGAQIGDPVNWEQFTGMSIETAGNGEFDGLAGASVTTGAWKTSLNQLYNFHLDTYGYTPLTEEQLLQIKKEAMVDGLTVTSYTNTNPYANYGITAIDIANDGTEDQAVIYTVEFVGYNPNGLNKYLIAFDLETGDVIDFVALSSDDTPNLGAEILNEDNWTQFAGKTSDDLLNGGIDTLAGATVTTDAWKASLQNVTVYHQWEFEGVVVLTPQQQFEVYKESLFTDAASFVDVTADKPTSPLVSTIFDAYDDQENFLGTVYHVTTIGASFSGITYIEFLIGIDDSNNFTGFYLVDDTETAGKTDPMYVETYGDSIIGDAIDATIALDAVAGSTYTYDIIVAAIESIATYHAEKYNVRPDSVTVDNAALLAAFPTATSFVSVYENYDFESGIGNIYEAQDGTGAALGYVYYGTADGFGPNLIEFTWGVALDGTTQVLSINESSESWGDAEEYASYDGSAGSNFVTSTWLNNYAGVDIATIISSPVDVVSGVSTTTGAMKAALENIAQYHIDQAVGGAN